MQKKLAPAAWMKRETNNANITFMHWPIATYKTMHSTNQSERKAINKIKEGTTYLSQPLHPTFTWKKTHVMREKKETNLLLNKKKKINAPTYRNKKKEETKTLPTKKQNGSCTSLRKWTDKGVRECTAATSTTKPNINP